MMFVFHVLLSFSFLFGKTVKIRRYTLYDKPKIAKQEYACIQSGKEKKYRKNVTALLL